MRSIPRPSNFLIHLPTNIDLFLDADYRTSRLSNFFRRRRNPVSQEFDIQVGTPRLGRIQPIKTMYPAIINRAGIQGGTELLLGPGAEHSA
jgi:hypothetical protein